MGLQPDEERKGGLEEHEGFQGQTELLKESGGAGWALRRPLKH